MSTNSMFPYESQMNIEDEVPVFRKLIKMQIIFGGGFIANGQYTPGQYACHYFKNDTDYDNFYKKHIHDYSFNVCREEIICLYSKQTDTYYGILERLKIN